jgi:hypothetical protein
MSLRSLYHLWFNSFITKHDLMKTMALKAKTDVCHSMFVFVFRHPCSFFLMGAAAEVEGSSPSGYAH